MGTQENAPARAAGPSSRPQTTRQPPIAAQVLATLLLAMGSKSPSHLHVAVERYAGAVRAAVVEADAESAALGSLPPGSWEAVAAALGASPGQVALLEASGAEGELGGGGRGAHACVPAHSAHACRLRTRACAHARFPPTFRARARARRRCARTSCWSRSACCWPRTACWRCTCWTRPRWWRRSLATHSRTSWSPCKEGARARARARAAGKARTRTRRRRRA
jgi:hypothetical protein